MAEVIPAEEQSNYETFRDCLSEPVLRALAAPVEKPIRKRRKKDSKKGLKNGNVNRGVEQSRGNSSGGASQTDDAEDLGEFIDVSTLPGLSLKIYILETHNKEKSKSIH
jgi:hypothetical protein